MSQIPIILYSYLYLILINIGIKGAIKEMSGLKLNHAKKYSNV